MTLGMIILLNAHASIGNLLSILSGPLKQVGVVSVLSVAPRY